MADDKEFDINKIKNEELMNASDRLYFEKYGSAMEEQAEIIKKDIKEDIKENYEEKVDDYINYANVAFTRDKTWVEGKNYSYIHPSVWTMDLPTSYQQDYHGTFISNGITFSTADNRIEIACREGISTCDGEAFDLSLAGKYVDIELSDGTVLACIIGGSKGNELGSDPTGVVHHDGSIFELLETEGVEGRVQRNGNENADKADLLHGCDIVGAYVYSEKRLYDSTTGEYTYYFSESIYN